MDLPQPLTQTHLSVVILDRLTHNPIARMPLYAEVSVTAVALSYRLADVALLDQFRGTYFFDPRLGPILDATLVQLIDEASLRALSTETRTSLFEAILAALPDTSVLSQRSDSEIRSIVQTSALNAMELHNIPRSQTQGTPVLRSFPLGLLATDHTGYASFDLTRIPRDFLVSGGGTPGSPVQYHFFVFPMGNEATRYDALDQARFTADAVFAKLEIAAPAFQRSLKSLNLPSMQTPGLVDWYLSPGSFASNPEFLVGADGCESLYPSQLALQQFNFSQVIRLRASPEGVTLPPQFKFGYVDDYRVSWYSLGHSLGEIQYSLPLAPGESVKLAVVDWSWASTTQRTEDTKLTEDLLHQTHRDRSITETVKAALSEWQHGGSFMGGIAGSYSGGNYGISAAIGGAYATSSGSRDLAANNVQELNDSFAQASSAQRELFSTVVVQARQEEKESIQTRTFTNYNHSHTLTILYYEVLRHFKVVVEWVRRRPAVLVQFQKTVFDEDTLVLNRHLLEDNLLDPKLKPGFDALEKLATTRINYSLNNITPDPTPPRPFAQGDIEFTMFELIIRTASDGDARSDSKILAFIRKADGATIDLEYLYVGPRGSTNIPTSGNHQGDDATDINLGNRYDGAGEGGSIFVRLQGTASVKWRDIAGFEIEKWGTNAWRIDQLFINAIGPGVFIPLVSAADGNVNQYIRENEPGSNSFTAFRRPDPDPPAPAPIRTVEQNLSADETYLKNKLLTHVAANSKYYDRLIVLSRDPNVIASEFEVTPWVGQDMLIDHAEPYPLEIFGDYIAYPFTDDLAQPLPLLEPERSKSEKLITLPTRGVFAEGKLGHCNISEEIDNTRFWKWDEHPIPIEAPGINAVTPVTPQPQATTVSPTPFPAALVNIVSPTAAPDPVGLAAALKVLSTPNIFRDMSGSQEVGQLLQTLANDSAALAKGGSSGGAGSGGKASVASTGAGASPDAGTATPAGGGGGGPAAAGAGTPRTVGEVNDLATGIRDNLPPSQANPLVGQLYQNAVDKTTASGGSGANAGGTAAPPPQPTPDDIIAQLNPLLGTSYADYNEFYQKHLQPAKFLGLSIGGNIHPDLVTELAGVEQTLRNQGLSDNASTWNIYSIGGGDPTSGGHRWGLAIDINYDTNPYVQHESGELELDRQLRAVYDRIVWLVLGKGQSDLDDTITKGIGATGGFRSVSEAYDALASESAAMKRYFQFMNDKTKFQSFIKDEWASIPQHFAKPDPDKWIAIMNQDYLTLGKTVGNVRAPAIAGADRPFSGANQSRRDPLNGFLDIPKPVVEALALSANGKNRRLLWGAVDFGAESGDVMHFDLRSGTFYNTLQVAVRAARAAIQGTVAVEV